MKNGFAQKIFLFAVSMSFAFSLHSEITKTEYTSLKSAVQENKHEEVESILADKSSSEITKLLTPRKGYYSLLAIATGRLYLETVRVIVNSMEDGISKNSVLLQSTPDEMLDLIGTALIQGMRFDLLAGLEIVNILIAGIQNESECSHPCLGNISLLIEEIVDAINRKQYTEEDIVAAASAIKNITVMLGFIVDEIMIPAIEKPPRKRQRRK
jgi:hypothetical protein